jgi:nitroreductase
LRLLKEGDRRKESIQGSTFARFVAQAPPTMVLAADFTSITAAFGERGRTVYLPVEAGHLSQTLRLSAAASGMSSGIVGAFDPARIKALFGIKEEPLLLLPMGYPLSDR